MDLLRMFISFTKVGVFAYGGGPSMIPLIQEEVVDVNGWMTIEEFTDINLNTSGVNDDLHSAARR